MAWKTWVTVVHVGKRLSVCKICDALRCPIEAVLVEVFLGVEWQLSDIEGLGSGGIVASKKVSETLVSSGNFIYPADSLSGVCMTR